MEKVEVKDLLQIGAHFGHQKERWNPKMRPFIFATKENVHIIDLEKTKEKAEDALSFVASVAKGGGKILFVSTKRQAKESVREAAQNCGMPYVVNRWLGGLLTNFSTIRKRLKRLKDLQSQKESKELEKFTKRERIIFDEEIEKLEYNIGGIKDLTDTPNALFVIDTIIEEVAIKEAQKLGIPIIATCDTNSNPDNIDYPIPANDDSIKTIEYFANLISDTINSAKASKKEVKKTKEKHDK